MNDEAALSTRPDFLPSPKFDCKATSAQLAKAKLDKCNTSRKNAVGFYVSLLKHSYAQSGDF